MHSKSLQDDIIKSLQSQDEILLAEQIYRYFSGKDVKGARFKPFRLYPHLINMLPEASKILKYEGFLKLCDIYSEFGLFEKGYYLDVNQDKTIKVTLTEEQIKKLKDNESFIFVSDEKEYLSWESISCLYILTDNWQIDEANVNYSTRDLLEALTEIVPLRVLEKAKSMAHAKAVDRINREKQPVR